MQLAAPFDTAQGGWDAKGANNFGLAGAGFKPALFLFLSFIAALVSVAVPSRRIRAKSWQHNGNGDKSLESWIWDAACSIRGAKDAPKYKEFILPLIFAKRLCDVFDDEINRIAKEVGSRAKAFKLVKHDKKLVRFFLPLEPKNPDDPVWSVIRKLADKIGEQLTTLSSRHRRRESPAQGNHRPRRFQRHHPRRARSRRRPLEQSDRADQRKALGAQRRRGGHHRPLATNI